MKNRFLFCLLLLLVFGGGNVWAQGLIIRPEASVGYMPTFARGSHNYALVQNYGGKLLIGLNDKLRFGLKADYVQMDFKNDEVDRMRQRQYVSTGIVLEAVVAKFFNAGIGTVGYIALGELERSFHNPFVLYTHLGFEYAFGSGLMLLAAYQADFVFTQGFGLNNAFRLGVGYKIPFKKKH